MTASELRITWGVITAQYALFAVLLLSQQFRAMIYPFTSLVIIGAIYVRVWILTDSKELKRRHARPITKNVALLFVVVIVGVLAVIVAMEWVISHFAVQRESIAPFGVAVLTCIWGWECIDAWRKYHAQRP